MIAMNTSFIDLLQFQQNMQNEDYACIEVIDQCPRDNAHNSLMVSQNFSLIESQS